MLVEVENDLEVQVGDRVELEIPAGSVVKLSLLVYVFPVIALIVGAIVGEALAEPIHMNPTLASVLGCVSGLGISIFALRWLDRGGHGKEKYYPRLRRVLN